uniref:C2H2-type domain-containing protein n=1 Tax=Magallana gigas TaxID=29159 RepID=A0A8W8JIZ2_MAGGI
MAALFAHRGFSQKLEVLLCSMQLEEFSGKNSKHGAHIFSVFIFSWWRCKSLKEPLYHFPISKACPYRAVTHPFKSCNALRINAVDNLNEQRVIFNNIDVPTTSQDMVIEDKNELDMTAEQTSYPVSFEPVQEPEVVIEVKDEPNVEIKDEPDLTNSSAVNFKVSCPFNFESVPKPDVDIEVKVEPHIKIKDETDIASTSGTIFQEHSCPVHLNLVSEPDMVTGYHEKPDANFEAPSSSNPVKVEPIQEPEIKDKPDRTGSSGNTNFVAQNYPVLTEPVQMPDSASQALEKPPQSVILKMGPQHFGAGKEKIVLGPGDFGPTETKESRLMREKKRMEEIGSCFYKCGICNEEFSNAMELQIHVQLHNGYENELIICNYCDKVFTGKTGTFSHLRHVHGIALDYAKSTKSELLLPWVQTNRESFSTLSVHRVKKLDCSVCGTKFTSLEIYKLDETVSNKTSEEEEQKTHKEHLCGKCQKDHFQNLNTRRRDGKKQYECAQCRRFFFKPLYEDHVRSLHGLLKLFKCNVCGMRSVSRPSLLAHKRSHKKRGTLN